MPALDHLARRDPSATALALLSALVVLLAGVGALPRWPGLVHLVALPPLGLFADTRILVTQAVSWPVFAGGLVLSLAARTLVLVTLRNSPWPPRHRELQGAAALQAVALVFALSAATLSFGASAVLFAALGWLGFGLTVVIVILLGVAPFTDGPTWRSRLAPSRRGALQAATVACSLGGLMILGGLADLGGDIASVALVPVSAAWTWLTAAALRDPERLSAIRVVGAAAVGVGLLAIAWVAISGPGAPPPAAPLTATRSGSLVLVPGVSSSTGEGLMFHFDPRLLGYTCQQTTYFSYAGPGDGAPQGDASCPIASGAPFEETDTYRSLDELVPWFAEQVESLPRPITALAQSQGAWVVREALTRDGPVVDDVVLAGGFATNPAGYPTGGAAGPGRVGIDLFELGRALPFGVGESFDPASPLSRELLSSPAAVEELFDAPLPGGVRMLSVTSSFDLPLLDDWRVPNALDACPVPVVHPNLVASDQLLGAANRFLDGDTQVGTCSAWRRSLGPLLRPFAAPPTDS